MPTRVLGGTSPTAALNHRLTMSSPNNLCHHHSATIAGTEEDFWDEILCQGLGALLAFGGR
jgi:hypothetical protein